MYAIVDISGKQFRVEKGLELKVPFSGGDTGTNLQIDRVLLVGDDTDTHIGQPVVAGAVVDATVLSHGRERKIIVFKFKRRKGYRRTRGHRQDFTMLRINNIELGKGKAQSATPQPAAKKSPAKKAAVKKPSAQKPAAAKKKTTKAAKTKQKDK